MKLSAHLYPILGLAIVTAITFHAVLLSPHPVIANDSPTANIMIGQRWASEGRTVLWLTDGYLGRNGGVVTYGITTPLQRWLPARYYNTVLFSLLTFLVGLGGYLFCLALGLCPLAAFTGACALMLSGDFITSVFSGHGGKFVMWVFLLFAVWLLTVGISKRGLLALFWCGVCGGIGVSGQLDIGMILMLFIAAWAVFLIWQTRAQGRWVRLSAGLAAAVVAGCLYSATTIVSLLGLANQASTSVSQETRVPEEQWNWATQWSLPKIETLTLIAPGFFGFGHLPDSPYWGSIGQDANWPERHMGFPRFSISTQGMGVVVIALAVCALALGLATHGAHRPVIIFWAVAGLIALLCAYGRYLDVAPYGAHGFGPYRLFYWLPKMDAMRNPLKFLYPLMLALAVLAACGMQCLREAVAAHTAKPMKPRHK